jgi:hypothetical protein
MTAQASELQARLIDLFGNPLTADPTQLMGNLMVSPAGNILIGTQVDNGTDKLQVNGTVKSLAGGYVFPDGTKQASGASGRNRIINGDCRIAQRGSSVVAGTGYTYGGPDRFLCMNSGGQGAFTQSTGTISYGGVSRPAVVQTINTAIPSFAAASVFSGIQQIIEGLNAYDLANQPITASFIFSTNVTGLYSVTLVDNNGAHACIKTFSATANTPAFVSVTFPAYALNIPSNNAAGLYLAVGAIGGTNCQTAAIDAWQSVNKQMASTAVNWATTVNNFISLTELQVEAGTVATPFERRPYQQELLLCQRYYQTDSVVVLPSRSDFHSPLMYKTPMRSAASVYWKSAGTGANGYVRDNDNARDVPVTSAGGTTTFCYPVCGGSPSLAINANTTFQYTASAEF